MKGHVVDSGMFALNAYFWGIQSLGGHEMHVPKYPDDLNIYIRDGNWVVPTRLVPPRRGTRGMRVLAVQARAGCGH